MEPVNLPPSSIDTSKNKQVIVEKKKDTVDDLTLMDERINKNIENAMVFIGQKVSGHWKETLFEVGNEMRVIHLQILDEGALDEVKSVMDLEGVILRVLLPGMATTMDYNFARLNISIDEKFIIKGFTRG